MLVVRNLKVLLISVSCSFGSIVCSSFAITAWISSSCSVVEYPPPFL